jgi:HK97 gp10 family phage protein
MATAFTAPGLPRLISTLDAAEKDVQTLPVATDQAGRIIVNAARSGAPVVTGYLRSTIDAETSTNSVVVSVGAVYGPPIHWGWAARNIRANPFLTTALERSERAVLDAYTDEVDAVVDKVKAD